MANATHQKTNKQVFVSAECKRVVKREKMDSKSSSVVVVASIQGTHCHITIAFYTNKQTRYQTFYQTR